MRGFYFPEGSEIKYLVVRDADFTKASLAGDWIQECTFDKVIFEGAKLTDISEHGNTFIRCSFADTSFVQAGLGYDGTSCNQCKFERAKFGKAVFIRAEFDDCRFLNCDLKGVDFNASSFTNCTFDGRLEGVWFRGGFELASDLKEFGTPRKNTMKNVSFAEASLWGVNFSNHCDLSSIIIPSDGKHELYDDWELRLSLLAKTAESWSDPDRKETDIFVKSYLTHAEEQRWFLLNHEEIMEEFGAALGRKILDTLGKDGSTGRA